MKAYLLDPSSPHVLACEKTLLPVLELMRERGMFSSVDLHGEGTGHLQLAQRLTGQRSRLAGSADDQSASKDGTRAAQPNPLEKLQQQRITILKAKHKQAKQEREQQMYRDASKPLKFPPPSQKRPSE